MPRTPPEEALPAPILERVLSELLPLRGADEMSRAVAGVLAAAEEGGLSGAALRALSDHCAVALRNADLHDALHAQVITDSLTGCYNRRGLDDHLRVEMVRARRYKRPLSLVLLDIDHFKGVNDEHGHAAGDDVLRAVARLLLEAFRTTDRVCRYGGDEFAVVFPETPRDRVVQLAERLRGRIAECFPDGSVPRPVTASFGVAGYPADAEDADHLLREADRALYAAKADGRDRVVAA